ncbi:hypothetical protein [Ferruginibacter sp. HRS2-29]|uniref:hypothetical protein n=1 Tax=Ferruginibacter sp. HRS2-29 TaxID=2487334 RepID=UPI0020CEFC80|nr:hypothetical protein [Ferruginibacter sp. HRS2-29]
MKASDTWRLIEKEELEMRRMKEEGAIKNARKEEKLEVARKMKNKGIDETLIKEMTSLKISIINKL